MKSKQSLALMLAFVLLLSLIAACSPNAADSPSPSAPAETKKPEEPAKQEPAQPAEEKYAKQISYSMMTWSNVAVFPENNWMLQQIEKKFNVKLQVQTIANSEYPQKLAVLAASNSLPDIIVTRIPWSQEVPYAKDGLLLQLDDYLDTSLPEYMAIREQRSFDALKVDGKLYALPSVVVPQDGTFQVRKDWLEKLNLQAPTNIREFEEVARRFAQDDPDGNGVADTYAFTLSPIRLTQIGWPFAYNLFDGYPYEWYNDNGKLVYGAIRPQFKDALRWLRKLVDEGLANVKADMTDPTMAMNDIYAGKQGFTFFPVQILAATDSRTMDLKKNTGGVGEFQWFGPMESASGNTFIPAVGVRSWNRTILNANIEEPERALDILNWMLTEEGHKYILLGEEGVHYTYDNEGVAVPTPEYASDPTKLLNLGIGNQLTLFSLRNLFGPNMPPHVLEGVDNNNKHIRYSPLYSEDLESMQKHGATLEALKNKFLMEALTKPNFNIDQEFDKYVDEWMKSGGDEVLAEAQKHL